MNANQLKLLEMYLKALSNKRRLLIIRFLKNKKTATVGEISREIRLSFRSTSKHLRVLFVAGLVEREQEKLKVHYRLANTLPIYMNSIINFL